MISVCFGWSVGDRPAKGCKIGHPRVVVNHWGEKGIGVLLCQ
jgi:hypothetical protein